MSGNWFSGTEKVQIKGLRVGTQEERYIMSQNEEGPGTQL